jgi:hypothetical protein
MYLMIVMERRLGANPDSAMRLPEGGNYARQGLP